MTNNDEASSGKHNAVTKMRKDEITIKLDSLETTQSSWVDFFEKKYNAPNDFMIHKRDEEPQMRKLF